MQVIVVICATLAHRVVYRVVHTFNHFVPSLRRSTGSEVSFGGLGLNEIGYTECRHVLFGLLWSAGVHMLRYVVLSGRHL